MTLIASCKTEDGIIMASDTRYTRWRDTAAAQCLNDAVKIYPVGSCSVAGYSGAYDIAIFINRMVQGSILPTTVREAAEHVSQCAIKAYSGFTMPWCYRPHLEILVSGISDSGAPETYLLSSTREFKLFDPEGSFISIIGVHQPLAQFAYRAYASAMKNRIAAALSHYLIEETSKVNPTDVNNIIKIWSVDKKSKQSIEFTQTEIDTAKSDGQTITALLNGLLKGVKP